MAPTDIELKALLLLLFYCCCY